MQEKQSSLPRVGRYVLVERLGGGGMGEVFRATDRLGVAVALKRLALREHDDGDARVSEERAGGSERTARESLPVTEAATLASGPIVAGVVPASPLSRPIAATLGLALAREFRALSTLRHPNVVEVLDYGFDGRGPFFTMQLLEGGVSIATAARGASFERKVAMLGELLRAVRYIHGRGVLHRDLSSSNVLFANGVVKVLDFGLAVLSDDRDPRLARWGTRGYRAPELQDGGLPSRRSDLFAVGIIGLEVLLERKIDGAAAIEEALRSLDARVRSLFERLTHRDPNARPDDAGAVLQDLARATGLTLPLDTTETLDSALTTASLVGRDRELASLDDALALLTAQHEGGAWRIEGESGIGKSRILDELRTHALVAGCLVLEGQAREEGGRPYEVLAGVVHGLALEVEPTASEIEALAPVVELGSPSDVRDRNAVESDPETVRARIFDAIRALFERVRRANGRPIVVLLEDVHWSSLEALGLVRRIAALAETTPLLLVVSHRDTALEAVVGELTELSSLRLGRIAEDEARRLVKAVFRDASRDLETRLARESEGHPFFLVELLRWIAEHGNDALVPAANALPHRIEALVRSRLLSLSPLHCELFEIAAVVARDVDPELVAAIAEVDSAAIVSWTQAGLAAGLLDVKNERLRFAHDKMREGVLLTIPAARRRERHLRAGALIERRAADPASESATLAHHFAHGGDERRAAHWAAIAGERAFASGANAEAIRLLGDAVRAGSAYEGDRVQRARLMRLMGLAQNRIGDYLQAHEHAVASLAELARARRSAPVRIAQTMTDVASLVGRRLGARAPSNASARELDEAALAHYLVAETALFRDDPGDMVWGLLRALALAEGRPPHVQVTIYSAAGFIFGTMRLDRIAEPWHARAIEIAERVGSQTMLAVAIHRRGVCAVVRAEWALADALLGSASEKASHSEDRRQWQEGLTVIGLAASFRGDLERATALLTEVHESAKRNGDRQGTLWGASLSALFLLRLGERGRAEVLLEEAEARIDRATSVFDRINFRGARALQLFGAGERRAAIREASDVIDRIATMRVFPYWTFHGLAAAQETLLDALESGADGEERRMLASACLRGNKEARRLALPNVFVRPSAHLWEARWRFLTGDRRGAEARFAKAEAGARTHGLRGVLDAVQRARR